MTVPVVKLSAICAAFLVTAFYAVADTPTWQELSSNLFTSASIQWQPPADSLPKNLWIYRRVLPHVFPATVSSNAIVLGSLQKRGFPTPSTNNFLISAEVPPNWCCSIPVLFSIQPGDAGLSFWSGDNTSVREEEIPDHDAMIKRARTCAALLGLNTAELNGERFYTHFRDNDGTTGQICGHGVVFPRHLDGIEFFSADDQGDLTEGFSMEFGAHGKIQAFTVHWSEMERYRSERTAGQDEITRCLRAHKGIVLPDPKDDYFARLKGLAAAKSFTITRVTPYYGEGVFSEVPTNDAPYGFAVPFAELAVVADFGNSNSPITVLAPVLSTEVHRLLGKPLR